MTYKKITLWNKVGYHLCESPWYKAYMLFGGWCIVTLAIWFGVSMQMHEAQDWIWIPGIFLHFALGMWSVWEYDAYNEKAQWNEQVDNDAQLNLFRDFHITNKVRG